MYFNASNKDGDHLVTGMARRKDRLVDGFLFLKINRPGLGVLKIPTLPDTSLHQPEEIEEHSAGGVKITCVVPMKKWRIQYEGKMKRDEDSFDVKIDLEWSSDIGNFNYDDMDDLSKAKAIALEPWSREYFKTLER